MLFRIQRVNHHAGVLKVALGVARLARATSRPCPRRAARTAAVRARWPCRQGCDAVFPERGLAGRHAEAVAVPCPQRLDDREVDEAEGEQEDAEDAKHHAPDEVAAASGPCSDGIRHAAGPVRFARASGCQGIISTRQYAVERSARILPDCGCDGLSDAQRSPQAALPRYPRCCSGVLRAIKRRAVRQNPAEGALLTNR
jgi:hypothetical protein